MQETESFTTSYASYLLRLRWHLQEDEWLCQILLTSVATGEQHYFTNHASLLAYLQRSRPVLKGEEPHD